MQVNCCFVLLISCKDKDLVVSILEVSQALETELNLDACERCLFYLHNYHVILPLV